METATQKLLLVDDEAGLRRSLNFGLSQRGYAIDEVEEGLPALKLIDSSYAQQRPYCVVMLDINLPDINGLKLLELIKSRHPGLPVIVVSAYGSPATPATVAMKHGDGYLDKPFLVDELTDLIARLPRPQPEERIAAPAPATQPQTVSAYAMVRLAPTADVMATFRSLYFMDNVIYCDAVYDQFDIVMLLNGGSQAEIEELVRTRIRSNPDVAEVTLSPIVRPQLDPAVAGFIKEYDQQRGLDPAAYKLAHGRASLSTYVFVDIEPQRLSEVFPKLYFMKGVVSCDATRGEHDAVLLVQSHSFEENERILTQELKLIDGIVRTSTVKVINLLEM